MKANFFSSEKLNKVLSSVLASINVREDVAQEVVLCLIETSLRGIDSHGVRLLSHYVRVVQEGRINPNPQYKYEQTSPTTAVLDADHTFGHAAASWAMKKCIAMAKEAGAGFASVRHSTHFSACAYYSLQAAKADMIGITATNTSPMMIPARGKEVALGTNPISFTFPVAGEEPVCIDMATTQVTWNHVQSAKQEGRPIEINLAVDKNMQSTMQPEEAVGLLPMGHHKGYAMAFVVDVLCSILGNASFGPNITEMFKNLSEKRNLTHFVGAIAIDRFLPVERFKQHMAQLVNTLRNIPSLDPSLPVLVPGDPEKMAMKKRIEEGIPLSEEVVESINRIVLEQNLSSTLLL